MSGQECMGVGSEWGWTVSALGGLRALSHSVRQPWAQSLRCAVTDSASLRFPLIPEPSRSGTVSCSRLGHGRQGAGTELGSAVALSCEAGTGCHFG